jgi:hypothetical protein
MNYTITYDDGEIGLSSEVPAPERLPQPGDVYVFTCPAITLAGVSYNIGDKLEIIERTTEAPHFRRSSLGNIVVRCKHFISVWTNIEWMIVMGRIILQEGN